MVELKCPVPEDVASQHKPLQTHTTDLVCRSHHLLAPLRRLHMSIWNEVCRVIQTKVFQYVHIACNVGQANTLPVD